MCPAAVVDLGIGAAGSEVVVLPNVFLSLLFSGTDFFLAQSVLGPLPIQIPAGTRLAARAQCSITDATDRLIDVVGYGMD